MNEEELNIQYICNKTLLDKDDELVPIILEMIKDSYKAGLCQSEFDNTMGLIEENQELKKKLNETVHKATEFESEIYELEKWLKHYIKLMNNNPDIIETGQIDILHEVSDKIEELKGNKQNN